MADLKALAAKYVRLTEEIEATRRAMLTALTANGPETQPNAFVNGRAARRKKAAGAIREAAAAPEDKGGAKADAEADAGDATTTAGDAILPEDSRGGGRVGLPFGLPLALPDSPGRNGIAIDFR